MAKERPGMVGFWRIRRCMESVMRRVTRAPMASRRLENWRVGFRTSGGFVLGIQRSGSVVAFEPLDLVVVARGEA